MIWRRFASLPLQRRLPLLMAAQLAIILVVSLLLTNRVLVQSARADARSRIDHAVEHVSETALPAMQDLTGRIRDVAAHPDVRAALLPGADAATRERARAALQPLSQVAAVVRRRDGTDASATGNLPAGKPQPIQHDTLTMGGLFEHAGRAHAWISTPVLDVDGSTLGHLAMLLRTGGPPDAVENLSGLTGEAVTFHLRSADGALWARHPGHIVPPPRRHVAGDGTLYYERDGVGRTIAAETRLASTPWLIVLETPVSAVHARAHRTVLLLGIASVVLMLAGGIVSWVLSRRIVRPLASLTDAAEAIAHGDYTRRVQHHGGDEIGRLANSFNLMAAEVEGARTALMQRVRDAQEAREDAERANRAKGDFLAVMSHELRTPLNAIGGYAQLLEMEVHGPVNAAQRDALMRIDRNQAHLLTLINDVLSYAKLDAGMVRFSVAEVAVAQMLADVEPLVAPQLEAAGIELVVAPAEGTMVRADPDKLQQVLINLLANAIKFTPAGGRVRVSCDVGDVTVAINVSDTGIGIQPDRLEAIFDPFFQADRALNRPADGVGLGLAISRDLARGMGGDLGVSSTPGTGSTFTITLPRAGVRSLQPA